VRHARIVARDVERPANARELERLHRQRFQTL
jgi:hypothetical protein